MRNNEGLIATATFTKKYQKSPFMSKDLVQSTFLMLDIFFPSKILLVLNDFQLECISEYFFFIQDLTISSLGLKEVLYGGDSIWVY